MRKNKKHNVINLDNTIRKSNEFSMAKLQSGLTLQQMQLLAFAIYNTQKNGNTNFKKHEFEKQFEMKRYLTKDAYIDSGKLLDLKASTQELENEKFNYWNVFSSMEYNAGNFIFNWTAEMIPHILDLKEKFVMTDLSITSKFKSSFTWTLYDFLKANYGAWYKTLTKEAIMQLFGVEDRLTYVRNTSELKRGVLDVAINEINKYTEYECWYAEKRVGRKITHFTIHFSKGKAAIGATQIQLETLETTIEAVLGDMLDYISLKDIKNVDEARKHILAIHQIDDKVRTENITIKEADLYIQKTNYHLKSLEKIKEKDANPSIYYNWINEEDN